LTKHGICNCLLQLLANVARVKALFEYSKDKQDEFIKFAEAPSGAHTEETADDIEEAELDEAWDPNAAEAAPTECLSEREDDGSE
jgi:hypothetical protein